MKRNSIILCVCAVVYGIFYLWSYPFMPTATSLATRALSAREADDRANAVVELTTLKDADVAPQLRRLVEESTDPKVMAAAISGLAIFNRRENLPLLYKGMNHDDKVVRQASYAAVMRYSPSLLEKLSYSVDDSKELRAEVASKLKESYDIPAVAPSSEPIASASPPAPSPGASPSPAPSASPSSSPSPSAGGPVPGLAPPIAGPANYENPSLNLLTWMCRLLAVMVLLAEMAGVIGLFVSEWHPAKRMKDTSQARKIQPAMTEEVEKALGKNSTGLWAKVAILVAGAMSVVALLTVAEMIQLAISVQQTALRVEQTAVYVSQTAVHMDETAVRVEQKLDASRKK